MRIFVILLVVLLLAAAAAAGAFFFMGGEFMEKKKLTRLPPPAEEVVEHWPILMDNVAFPSYRGGQVTSFVYVNITMTLRGDYESRFLNPYLPKIRDKIIRKYFRSSVPMKKNGLQVNYKKIESDIQKIVDDLFLPGLILNVSAEFSAG